MCFRHVMMSESRHVYFLIKNQPKKPSQKRDPKLSGKRRAGGYTGHPSKLEMMFFPYKNVQIRHESVFAKSEPSGTKKSPKCFPMGAKMDQKILKIDTMFALILDRILEPILAHAGTKNGQKFEFLGFQERVQDKTDFGAVFLSILTRFSRVWQIPK